LSFLVCKYLFYFLKYPAKLNCLLFQLKKWVPAVKEQWYVVKTSAEPHVQLLTTKTVEGYEATRKTISPHLSKAKEFVHPYYQVQTSSIHPFVLFVLFADVFLKTTGWQEARKFSKPYIDQIAVVAKPHVDKVQVVLKPYTNKVVHVYGKFLESATTYHSQVSDFIFF